MEKFFDFRRNLKSVFDNISKGHINSVEFCRAISFYIIFIILLKILIQVMYFLSQIARVKLSKVVLLQIFVT